MTIQFRCPHCRHKLKTLDGTAGKQARCKCGRSVVVPPASSPEFAPAHEAPPRPARPKRPAPVGQPYTSGAAHGAIQEGLDVWSRLDLSAPATATVVGNRAHPADVPALPPPRTPPRTPAPFAGAPAGTDQRALWLWVGASAFGVVSVLAVCIVLAIWLIGAGNSGQPPGPETAVASAPPPVQPPPPRQEPKPPPRQPATADAWAALEASEKKAGDDYEAVAAACARFLAENPSAPPEQRRQARQKIDTELPARIDDRDYRRASEAATAARSDGDTRKPWDLYLARHPSGRHAEEARRRLDDFTPWKVELVGVKTETRFPINSDLTYYRTGAERQLALVTVRFEARSAVPGTPEDRLRPAMNFISADALDFLKGQGKIVQTYAQFLPDDRERLEKPARLFMANQVALVLGDRTRLAPAWTSQPSPCAYGSTIAQEKADLHIGEPATDPAVIRYVRGDGNTVALVQPGRPVELTLVFPMPSDQTGGELLFYDCRPLPIDLRGRASP